MSILKIINAGPDDQRFNLVLCGERASIASVLSSHAQDFISRFNTEFSELKNAVNIWLINELVDFHSVAQAGNVIQIHQSEVWPWVSVRVPQVTCVGVLIGDLSGGVAGGKNMFFVSTVSSGWLDTAMHEFGHTRGLVDEYAYSATFTGTLNEDAVPNVTANLNRATCKWGDLATPGGPWPTRGGSGPQMFLGDIETRVGLFEGGYLYSNGLYRSQLSCRMRSVTDKFCAVCRRHIVRSLAKYIPDVAPPPPPPPPPPTKSIALVSGSSSTMIAVPADMSLPVVLHSNKYYLCRSGTNTYDEVQVFTI